MARIRQGTASHADRTAATDGFEYTVRVYYEDTDAGGVVYYANYLKFFERARTEWLRAAGISQQRLDEGAGLIFVVRSTALEYHAPARLDDLLAVTSAVARMGRVSVEFEQRIWRVSNKCSGKYSNEQIDEQIDEQRELLATGNIKVGCVQRETLRPTPFPESIGLALGAIPTKIMSE